MIIRIFYVFLFMSSASFGQEEYCDCVFSYLCKNELVVTTGEGIIDVRFGENCACGPCKTTPVREVCCRLPSNATASTTAGPVAPGSKCGQRNPDGVGYKIGVAQDDAVFGEFPWMVALLHQAGKYRCGGSLIHPSVVLTAAHCVRTPGDYLARAGEWDSSTTREIFKHQDRKVSSVKTHEGFKESVFYNDIALLFLERPFELDVHIQVACLPSQNTVINDGECYATGWGKDKWGRNGTYPAILKKVLLPMVDHRTCQENLRNTRLGPYYKLHKSFVCAGGRDDKDTCTGDGGGPLLCLVPGQEQQYQQIGITAWGIECNLENVPGVYTNVPLLRPWIDQQMEAMGFDTKTYQY